jgi:hypothetical protein
MELWSFTAHEVAEFGLFLIIVCSSLLLSMIENPWIPASTSAFFAHGACE